jgi:hypothetical protein
VGREVDPDLGHDLDGQGVKAFGMRSGRIGVDHFAFQMARLAFCHLAPTGIPRAEEKDLELRRHARSRCVRHNTSGSMVRI